MPVQVAEISRSLSRAWDALRRRSFLRSRSAGVRRTAARGGERRPCSGAREDLKTFDDLPALGRQLPGPRRRDRARGNCQSALAAHHASPDDLAIGSRFRAAKLEVDRLANGSSPRHPRLRWTAPRLDEVGCVPPRHFWAAFGVCFDWHRSDVRARSIVRTQVFRPRRRGNERTPVGGDVDSHQRVRVGRVAAMDGDLDLLARVGAGTSQSRSG